MRDNMKIMMIIILLFLKKFKYKRYIDIHIRISFVLMFKK